MSMHIFYLFFLFSLLLTFSRVSMLPFTASFFNYSVVVTLPHTVMCTHSTHLDAHENSHPHTLLTGMIHKDTAIRIFGSSVCAIFLTTITQADTRWRVADVIKNYERSYTHLTELFPIMNQLSHQGFFFTLFCLFCCCCRCLNTKLTMWETFSSSLCSITIQLNI